MKRLVVPMELKKVSAAGEFSGYASIFDNLDLGYDVIEKGAFQEIVKTPEGKVLTLFQHDAQGYTASGGLPIGLSDVEQDDKGLHFDSKLIMEDPFVQRVHTHLKAKTLNGMSIGFDVLPGGAEYTEAGRAAPEGAQALGNQRRDLRHEPEGARRGGQARRRGHDDSRIRGPASGRVRVLQRPGEAHRRGRVQGPAEGSGRARQG
jgi:HK97 family phage prohead protease